MIRLRNYNRFTNSLYYRRTVRTLESQGCAEGKSFTFITIFTRPRRDGNTRACRVETLQEPREGRVHTSPAKSVRCAEKYTLRCKNGFCRQRRSHRGTVRCSSRRLFSLR